MGDRAGEFEFACYVEQVIKVDWCEAVFLEAGSGKPGYVEGEGAVAEIRKHVDSEEKVWLRRGVHLSESGVMPVSHHL